MPAKNSARDTQNSARRNNNVMTSPMVSPINAKEESISPIRTKHVAQPSSF